jgi:carboxymethylenebutenolidase
MTEGTLAFLTNQSSSFFSEHSIWQFQARISHMHEREMIALWEEHTRHEFATCEVESTLATMLEDAHVNHVPVMTGGTGKASLREFYANQFISSMPPDTTLRLISRTVGQDQLVDEMIFSFTHTQEMPWMLPGVPPTNRTVEIPLVAIVGFREGKLAHEHIYWDQASVLKQIGLLNEPKLPIYGAETAYKLANPHFVDHNKN